jgi:hypothetical protein
MDDMDRSECSVAEGRERDLDLLRLIILTGKRFSSPKPESVLVGRSSSGALDSDAMMDDN